jgi:hypothetical protein
MSCFHGSGGSGYGLLGYGDVSGSHILTDSSSKCCRSLNIPFEVRMKGMLGSPKYLFLSDIPTKILKIM